MAGRGRLCTLARRTRAQVRRRDSQARRLWNFSANDRSRSGADVSTSAYWRTSGVELTSASTPKSDTLCWSEGKLESIGDLWRAVAVFFVANISCAAPLSHGSDPNVGARTTFNLVERVHGTHRARVRGWVTRWGWCAFIAMWEWPTYPCVVEGFQPRLARWKDLAVRRSVVSHKRTTMLCTINIRFAPKSDPPKPPLNFAG
jgi:hypothetical protein